MVAERTVIPIKTSIAVGFHYLIVKVKKNFGNIFCDHELTYSQQSSWSNPFQSLVFSFVTALYSRVNSLLCFKAFTLFFNFSDWRMLLRLCSMIWDTWIAEAPLHPQLLICKLVRHSVTFCFTLLYVLNWHICKNMRVSFTVKQHSYNRSVTAERILI